MKGPDILHELYRSDDPVLMCDGNLRVVDANEAANRIFGNKIIMTDFEEHMSRRDAATVKSLMYCAENGIERRIFHAVTDASGMMRYKLSLVVLRHYFGRLFFEFHLFRDRQSLLRSFEARSILPPASAYKPQYEFPRSGSGADVNAEKLNRVFRNNMLANLYAEAENPSCKPCSFDLIFLTRKLTVDISKRLEFIKGDFHFSCIGIERNVCPGMSLENFINMYTMLMYLTSCLAGDGKIKVAVGKGKEGTGIVFYLTAADSDTSFVGEFAFSLLAEMFPEYSAFVYIIIYMCELFGVGCFADIDSSGRLTIELNLSDSFGNEEFEVMVKNGGGYSAWIDNAVKLLRDIENER